MQPNTYTLSMATVPIIAQQPVPLVVAVVNLLVERVQSHCECVCCLSTYIVKKHFRKSGGFHKQGGQELSTWQKVL